MNEINMRINDYLQALSKSNKFSGSVLASLGFEEIFAQGFGMANVELSVKNTKYSKFRIASITKSFTAIAVLQLVEKGVIHLEDSLDKYFPSQYGADRIHISNLLNHTSGIVNYFEDSDLMKWMGTRSTQAELINKFNSRPLEFEPGQEYKYSNSGYVLLGALIEKVTGQPYHAYFQEHIFKPAGMYDTSVEEPSQILKERASGYQLDENGRLQNASYVHMSNAHAAGAIISTVGDL